MTAADRTAVDEHLREAEAIVRHIELAARARGNSRRGDSGSRPYRLSDARADADRALARLGQARRALLGTAAYLGIAGVTEAQAHRAHCVGDEYCARPDLHAELRRVAAVTGQPLGKLVADLSALAAGVQGAPLVPCPVCGGEAAHAQDVLARTVINPARGVNPSHTEHPEEPT